MTDRPAQLPVLASIRFRAGSRLRFRYLLLLILVLLPHSAVRAELLPAPTVPPYGLYQDWLDAHRFAAEGWIPGMHSRHWLPPTSVPRGWPEYWVDELRLLPESGWVLWVRRPAILDYLGGSSAGEDPYANRIARNWPEAVRRETLSWEAWFERHLREERLRVVREKALQTHNQLKSEEARGSLIDLDIPLDLPDSIERIVGRGDRTNITVTGRETITFSGETTRNSEFQSDESGRGQPLFPRLEMKQELQVKLSGTVGEKVHVEVENNSLAQGDAANRIRIRYEGDEDEVIELIEMGDTQLSLPGSGLISYRGQNKGLFGIKMMGHLGPLEFTAIASKQEGEVSSKTFNNTGQDVQADSKRDIDFAANQFFFLDHPAGHLFDGGSELYHWRVDYGTLEVFVSNGIAPSIGAANAVDYFKARVYADTLNNGVDAGDLAGQNSEIQPFRKLNGERDYIVRKDADGFFSILQLSSPIQESEFLAVSYRGLGQNGEANIYVGESSIGKLPYNDSAADTLTLELIKPDPYKPESPTWDYMLRNIYRLGGRGLDFGTLELEIERVGTSAQPTFPEGSSTPYLRFFGLDQHKGEDLATFDPDGLIDRNWVDVNEGLLIMPILEPFNPPADSICAWTTVVTLSDTLCEALSDNDLNPAIYTTKRETILNNPSHFNRFRILYKSATVASRFNLNAFDILAGSEVVTLDGRTLVKGTDYSIDYLSGDVQLMGQAASELTASSNLQVTYQFRPFIGGGTSSLLGVHGTYRLGEKNLIASSWLYESQHSGSRRPRLGEESTRNVVGNLLATFTANPDFLTRAANLLPLVDTDAMSTATLSGELAVSFPNPNVDDEAFLDDMEGAEDADELSMHRRQWTWASEPADVIRVPGGADIETAPLDRARHYYWFHPQNTTRREDFNLNLPEQEAQEGVDVLQLFVPVNLNEQQLTAFPRLVDTDTFNRQKGDSLWAGLMRGFPGQGLDLSEAEYLEIWVNDFQQEHFQRTGRIHFDMGTIDEDWWEPEKDVENTEDPGKLGIFNTELDVGFDGIASDSESEDSEHPYRASDDPVGDDYYNLQMNESFGNSYFKVNGLEANTRLDSEDLNADGDLDQANYYFTLEVDLADEPFTDMVTVYQDETGSPPENNKSWRLYRVNLDEARVISDGTGQPDWTRIRYFRFWVEGFNGPGQDPVQPFNRLEVASIKLVGNRWRSHGIQSVATGGTLAPTELAAGEDLRVEVVNTKDNANFTWPFGEEIDPNTGLPEREQALNVVCEQVQPGHQAVIRKDYQGLNLTGYRKLSFYVHPDQETAGRDLFLRAAQDSSEYYEWRYRPSTAGWTEVNLKLQDWTDLKLSSDADTASVTVADQVFPDRTYTLTRVGNPDLSRVRALFFGVVNDVGELPLTGDTWLNDLSVREVKRSTGYAGQLKANLSMAGVINLDFNYQERDAEFRPLQTNTGQGRRTRNWSLASRSHLQHYLPLFGYKLPITATYGKTLSLPKYELSSDVELGNDLREERKTTATTRTLSGTLSRSPSQNWLGRILLDKFTLGGSVRQSRNRGPLSIELSEQIAYNAAYDTQFKDRRLGLPLGARLRWLPNSLRLTSAVSRARFERWKGSGERYVPQRGSVSGTLTNSAALNWNFMDSFKASFSIKDDRNLAHEEAQRWKLFGKSLNIGFQKSQGQSLRLDYTLPIIKRFRPKVTYNSNYSQSAQDVILGAGTSAAGTRNLHNSNSMSTNYNFQVGSWFERLGGQSLKAFRARRAPDEAKGEIAPGRAIPGRQASRLLVPVDNLRGHDPRMLKRRTRRWFDDELEVHLPDAAAAADSSGEGVDPKDIIWATLDLLTDLKPLKVDLRRDVNTQFNSLLGSPTLLYRLGFSENPELAGTESGQQVDRRSPDSFSESRVLKLSTGVTVAENLQISGNFDFTRNDHQTLLSRTITTNRKWPSLSADISGVEKWGIWGDLLESSSLGLSFSRELRLKEDRALSSEDRDLNTSLSPRWNITWANKMQTNLSSSYTSGHKIRNSSESKDNKFSVDLTWNYNLSAPNGINIPGLRGIRFSSRMDLTANTGYQRLRSLRLDSAGFETLLAGSNIFKISPGASYQFSEKLRGSANITFTRTKRFPSKYVSSRLRLDLRTTFVF